MPRRLAAIAAFCAVSAYALAATGYAWHAREKAVDATAHVARLRNADARESNYRAALLASIRADAGIAGTDTEQQIVAKITDLLYQRARFDGPFKPTGNDALRYVWNMRGDNREYCSSLSSTLIWALGLFGIDARRVNLAARSFLDGSAPGDTHTLVEVKAGGAVYLTDPTFDVTYHCGGSPDNIDAKRLHECVRSGSTLTWTSIGKPRKGRTLGDYYIPLAKLAHAVDAGERPDRFYTFEYPSPGWLGRALAKERAAAKGT